MKVWVGRYCERFQFSIGALHCCLLFSADCKNCGVRAACRVERRLGRQEMFKRDVYIPLTPIVEVF